MQWAMGTSLKPFVDLLEGEMRDGFLTAYRAALAPHYPRRKDGVTLLPFHRLFFVARKA